MTRVGQADRICDAEAAAASISDALAITKVGTMCWGKRARSRRRRARARDRVTRRDTRLGWQARGADNASVISRSARVLGVVGAARFRSRARRVRRGRGLWHPVWHARWRARIRELKLCRAAVVVVLIGKDVAKHLDLELGCRSARRGRRRRRRRCRLWLILAAVGGMDTNDGLRCCLNPIGGVQDEELAEGGQDEDNGLAQGLGLLLLLVESGAGIKLGVCGDLCLLATWRDVLGDSDCKSRHGYQVVRIRGDLAAVVRRRCQRTGPQSLRNIPPFSVLRGIEEAVGRISGWDLHDMIGCFVHMLRCLRED